MLSGRGRLTIEQRPDRFTVTITMPDDDLTPVLRINGIFYTTIVYSISEMTGRSGGAGAGGPQSPSRPTWIGDKLVIPNARPAARASTTTYSLDGDRLKLETHVEMGDGRANDVTQWFTKVVSGSEPTKG